MARKEYTKAELKKAVKTWLAREQEKAMALTLEQAETLRLEGRRYNDLAIPNLLKEVKVLKVGWRESKENQVKAYLAKGLKLFKATFAVGGPNGEMLVPLGVKAC